MGSEAPWISIMLKHRTELNLTAGQVSALEKLRSDFERQAGPTRVDLENADAEIARLLQEKPVDLARVKNKIDEAERLRAEFRYLRVEALENGKAVLSAEQRHQLENLASSFHGRFRRPQGQPS
jgi:Spy/CpxP family protein refolding chaperone